MSELAKVARAKMLTLRKMCCYSLAIETKLVLFSNYWIGCVSGTLVFAVTDQTCSTQVDGYCIS